MRTKMDETTNVEGKERDAEIQGHCFERVWLRAVPKPPAQAVYAFPIPEVKKDEAHDTGEGEAEVATEKVCQH